jgi:hypothetical protein
VKLNGTIRGAPAFDQSEVGSGKQRIVCGQRNEERRRVRRHVDSCERPIDVGDERRGSVPIGQGSGHRQHRTGRKADHADAVWVDMPFSGPLADQAEGGARIGNLGSQAGGRPIGRRARRWRCRRAALLRRPREFLKVGRGLVQPVFQHECRHPAIG